MAPPPPPPAPPPPPGQSLSNPSIVKSGNKNGGGKTMDRNAMLNQIRQGTRLKKAAIINDRSAPLVVTDGKLIQSLLHLIVTTINLVELNQF